LSFFQGSAIIPLRYKRRKELAQERKLNFEEEKMKKGVIVLLVVILGLMGMAGARADEISDTIERAKTLYQEGKYSEASSELQFVVGQIQNLQAEQLKKLLPDPLAGWTAEEATASTAPMGFFGGGVTANKTYNKEDTGESIEIQIITQSPLLQTVMMWLTNPMMLAAEPNAKLVRVKGEKAVEKFSAQDKEGELSLILEGKTLITVTGSEISDKNILYKYMEKMDFGAIKKTIAG